jgi:branched-chain amino acid transport system substrate-binding protein
MKHRLRAVAVLAVVVTLLGLLTACGSDKKSSSSSDGTSGTTGTTAKQPTGDPIVIGTIGTYSNPNQTVGDPAAPRKAIEAWAKWVNAKGGINGHPLKLIVEDDANDPVKSKAAIQKLIEQDHVIAIVDSNDSSFDSTWADYVKGKNIPVIGGQSYSLNWTSPPFFLSGSDVITSVANEAVAAKEAGYKGYSTVLCSEAAVCAQAIPLHKAAAQQAGINFAGAELASSTQANYTSTCLKLKDAGADVIAVGGVDPKRMKQDCERQGFKPGWILPATAFTVQAAKDLETAISTVQSFPWFYDGPETKDFHAAMKQYSGIKEEDDSEASAIAWVSGLMFEKAVELSGATGVPTTADVLKGLNSFKGETLGGLAVPLTFGDPRPDGGRFKCYFTAEYKDGKFSTPKGLKTDCLTF